jgi:hypothetical protein
MADVFLSYARRSGPVVKALVADLEALGHEVWYDQDLSGGQAWWDEILGRIRRCAVFVLVLDPETLKSTACMRELGYATALGAPVLPVQVSPEVSTGLLPPALSQLQIVRFVEPDREAAIRLARALTHLPRRGPLPDPLPAAPEIPTSYLGGLGARIAIDRDLGYQEQMSLFIELRRALDDPETAEDARVLLLRLKGRRDLYAAAEKEIDHALANRRQEEPAGAARDPAPPGPPGQEDGVKPPKNPTSNESAGREQESGRIVGALAGAALATIVSLVVMSIYFGNFVSTIHFMTNSSIAFGAITGVGGLVAGAISGTDRRAIAASSVGALITWFVFLVPGFVTIEGAAIAFSVGAVFGAMAGRLAPRRTLTS